MKNSRNYGEDYFEDGIVKGLSGYQNYSWMPTRSFSEAIEICKNFDFASVIDYGCAKGFLVHALRLLGKNAVGLDISKYAIGNGPSDIREYLFHIQKKKDILDFKTDLLIGKDVLEHIPEEEISELFGIFHQVTDRLFFAIPLADNGRFRIREYEIDGTHVTKKDEEWWIKKFNKAGFKIKTFDYSFGYLKNKWTRYENKFGNGFFYLEKA